MGAPFANLLAFLPPASRPQAQVGAREGMDDGMLGYYPAISVFRGGAAEVNFGPDFWYPPPDLDRRNSDGERHAAHEGANGDREEQGVSEAEGDVDMIGVGVADEQAGKEGSQDEEAEAGPARSGDRLAPPGGAGRLRAVAERYDEQIVEDVVADIVDEVDFWMQDGARVIDRTGGRDAKAETTGGIAPAREEIKEIVQDD